MQMSQVFVKNVNSEGLRRSLASFDRKQREPSFIDDLKLASQRQSTCELGCPCRLPPKRSFAGEVRSQSLTVGTRRKHEAHEGDGWWLRMASSGALRELRGVFAVPLETRLGSISDSIFGVAGIDAAG